MLADVRSGMGSSRTVPSSAGRPPSRLPVRGPVGCRTPPVGRPPPPRTPRGVTAQPAPPHRSGGPSRHDTHAQRQGPNSGAPHEGQSARRHHPSASARPYPDGRPRRLEAPLPSQGTSSRRRQLVESACWSHESWLEVSVSPVRSSITPVRSSISGLSPVRRSRYRRCSATRTPM